MIFLLFSHFFFFIVEEEKKKKKKLLVVLFSVLCSFSPVPGLPVVEPPVHPVYPPLHEAHVAGDQEQVGHDAADVPVYPRERGRPAALGEAFDERRQQRVEGHGLGGHPDLLEDGGARGHGEEAGFLFVRAGKEGGAEDEVDVVDPDPFFIVFFWG